MRIPVWIFTGPLGAGKSTVINAVLDALPKSSNPACITHHFAMSYGCESTPVRRDPASAGRSKSHANETAARLNLAFYDEVYLWSFVTFTNLSLVVMFIPDFKT